MQAEAKVATGDDKKKPKGPPVVNKSFVTNMFRGEVITKEVFPYPYAIDDEQRENIAAFVDPVTSFFTVSEIIFYYYFCIIFGKLYRMEIKTS